MTPQGLSAFFRNEQGGSSEQFVTDLLRAIRVHLQMEVAFISQFALGHRFFRHVDHADGLNLLKIGDSDPLDQTYCQRIVDGRLPELMRDANEIPEARALPVTHALPVGAHMSVPIRFPNGQVYGTFCCFSRKADPTLIERDLHVMRAFADLAASRLIAEIAATEQERQKRDRIVNVLTKEDFTIVYQPIFSLGRKGYIGVESLTRFSAAPQRSPDQWFREAAEVGLGDLLELAAVHKALQALEVLPPPVYIAINVSPATILSERFAAVLRDVPLSRIVLEITEHSEIHEYPAIRGVLEPLRAAGLRLAIDDAGAGYASLRHILNLQPDIVKLDCSLVHGVHGDSAKRALIQGMVLFSQGTEMTLLAEGVETTSELATLDSLGVSCAQGYLFSRPAALDGLSHLFQKPSRAVGAA
jgi:EAL domain-containing protein (putative c-di-GMP-specific phosphodiesterase class I)